MQASAVIRVEREAANNHNPDKEGQTMLINILMILGYALLLIAKILDLLQ